MKNVLLAAVALLAVGTTAYANPCTCRTQQYTAAPTAPALTATAPAQAQGQVQGQQYRSFSVEGQTNVTNSPATQTYAPAPVRRQPMQNNQFRADRKIRGL